MGKLFKAKLRERLENTRKRLKLYMEAEEAVLSGAQSYSLEGRTLNRGNLETIRRAIKELSNKETDLEMALEGKGTRKSIRIVPRDI